MGPPGFEPGIRRVLPLQAPSTSAPGWPQGAAPHPSKLDDGPFKSARGLSKGLKDFVQEDGVLGAQTVRRIILLLPLSEKHFYTTTAHEVWDVNTCMGRLMKL